MDYLITLFAKIVSIVLLLLDNNFVTSQEKACIDKLPPFVHQQNEARSLPVGIQAIVPSYEFSCAGHIQRWGIALEAGRMGEHGIHLQVWRPVHGEQGSFTLLGSNYFHIVPFPGEKLTYLRPDRALQLAVTKGDVVGFYLEDNLLVEDDFQLQCRNRTGSTVLYDYSNESYTRMHVDTLTNRLTDAAPIITIHLDRVSTPTPSSETTPTTPPTPTARPNVTTNLPTDKLSNGPKPTTPTSTTPTPPTDATPTMSTGATPTDDRGHSKLLLGCVLVGSVTVMALLVLVVLCVRARRRREGACQHHETGVVIASPAAKLDIQESIGRTPLTENPAYDHTHNGLVASLTWLPKQGKFQIWKAQYYETPILLPAAKGGQRLERSYHHYECPATFLRSNHHYEQI